MNSVGAESTTAQLAKDVPLEKDAKTESKPEELPGSFPETPAADELSKPIGINPLPAADGGLNPIKLAPGEPVPKEFTTADVNTHVKLDQESYEKSDALPGVDTSALNIPPITGTMIPESSLPMGNGNPTINSVGANSTTAALAAQVPKEPKVPEVVKESQEKAGVDPEASGIASEVDEKKQVEEELKDKVPEAPTTSEGIAGEGTKKSEGDKTLLETAAALTAGAAATATAVAVATKDKAVEQASQLPDSVKEKLPASVQETIAPVAKENTIEEVSPQVPAEVKESIAEAGKSPEAAGNTAAVEEKKAVEAELLKEVKPAEGISDAPKKTEEPAKAAEEATETAAAPKTAEEGPTVVEPPAPAKEVATTSTPPNEANGANGANGAGNGTGSSAPTTPAKSAKASDPATPSSNKSDQKKKNRVSGFFGKLKAKISHKDGEN